MPLVLDSRETRVVNFQDQEKKRGISLFLGSSFHGKESWAADKKGGERLGFHIGRKEIDNDSSESSSIGRCSNSTVDDGDNEEDEVQSRFKSPLCMGSLEDSLPIKRGLSNYFSGKAKSFGCLSDAISVKHLAKPEENPLNKRRRIVLASKNGGTRSGSCSNLSACVIQKSPFPLVSLLEKKVEEEEEEEEDDNNDNAEKRDVCTSPLPQRGKFTTFRSPRSLSLSDLRHV